MVEDEPRILNLTSTLLRRRGLDVLTAPNGEQALVLASNHAGRIDVLLTDVVMPWVTATVTWTATQRSAQKQVCARETA